MNAILDVHYRQTSAVTACVEFDSWQDRNPAAIHVSVVDGYAEYVPGRFFERELPCLLDALGCLDRKFEVLVVDGFVHLKPPQEKGLGFYLAESLPYHAAVVAQMPGQSGLKKSSSRMTPPSTSAWLAV